MYREWLEKMVAEAPRGTKTRLAGHLGLTADMISKTLSGTRAISAEELRKISEFFNVVPPGFNGAREPPPIVDDRGILDALQRIDGLQQKDVELAFEVIQTSRRANSVAPERSQSGDQSEFATPRRGS